jgi:hypothetical protein
MRFTLALAASLVSTAAFAGPDLTTNLLMPSPVVYQSANYRVAVKNIGNAHANVVTVTIGLPATHTSPQVFPMGTVGTLPTNCSRSNTTITCTINQIKIGKTATITIPMTVPFSSAPLVFTSTASVNGETQFFNNADSDSPIVQYVSTPITATTLYGIDHCTGTGLTAWFECTKFPSSISSHDHWQNDDGTISIPLAPDYSGAWWQLNGSSPDATRLSFEYYDEASALVGTFEGRGVGSGCFEGVMDFHNGWVSPYSLCP